MHVALLPRRFFGAIPALILAFSAAASGWAQATAFLYDRAGNTVSRLPAISGLPVILQQSGSQVIGAGGLGSLSVLVADVAGASYQWRLNSINIAGATNETLLLPSVSAASEGSYSVVVTNASGSVTSAGAVIYWDADADGLPDSWEIANFGNLGQVGSSDFDRDGVSNLDEFRDGTDPKLATSFRPRLTLKTILGTVAVSPDLPSYAPGQAVTVSVVPFVGQSFIGWAGDLSGAALTSTVVMNGNKTITAVCGLPLGQSLNYPALAWTTGGDSGWYGQSRYTQDGSSAVQSGPIGLRQQTWIETSVTMRQPGTVTFYWRAHGGGTLTFTIGGISSAAIADDNTDWRTISRALPAGTSVLRWTYARTASNAQGSDSMWLDRVNFTPVPLLDPPAITSAAVASATLGQPFRYAIEATNGPTSFAATGLPAGLTISNTTGVISGTPTTAGTSQVTLRATNLGGVSAAFTLTLTTLSAASLANLSVRTTMPAGQTLIVGFVLAGGTKDVLVRAAGPALAAFGLPGTMADPKLELYRGTAKVAENDDWTASLASTFVRLGAFAFPAGSKDAAILQNLSGANTVQTTGAGPGIVLVEGYDAGENASVRLVNLSARNRVGTGDDILIAGFVIAGTGTQRLLIRAVGPALAAFGVPGTLVDPKLEVYSGNGAKITENDNWDPALAGTFASVGAFGFPANSKDSALVVTLAAGNAYTVQVKGADGGTGESLVEIYELPP